MGKELTGRTPRRNSLFPIRGEDALRAGILLGLVAVLTALYPSQPSFDVDIARLGKIAREEIIAPETFYVYKSDVEYDAEIEAVQGDISPVVVQDVALAPRQVAAAESLFNGVLSQSRASASDSLKLQTLRHSHPAASRVSDASFRHLMRLGRTGGEGLGRLRSAVLGLLLDAYADGVLLNKGVLPATGRNVSSVVMGNGDRSVPISDTHDLYGIRLSLQEDIVLRTPDGSPLDIKAVYEITDAFLVPNLSYDPQATGIRRAEASSNVSRIKGTVLKDERIIDEHELVTSDHIAKLNSLAIHMNERRSEDPWTPVLRIGTQAILVAFLMAILFGYLKVFRTATYDRTSNLLLFGILIVMPTVVAHYALANETIKPLLVPIALSAMLATVLFDAAIGLVVTLVCAALCSSILGSLQHNLIFLITGVIGAYSARQVLHRSDFYRPIAYLSVAYTLTILATGAQSVSYTTAIEFFHMIRWDIVFGLFTAAGSSILTIGLLPIFESVFNVVTPITLLELSDLNRPLLRNLAIRAPGTYSHSIIMASLSEAAADAIIANRLLCRVGCYYHDIGKMIRPHYFIENQKGVNPHDELQPKMSALILISHVKDGVELAREEGLPPAIIALIPQHHGTSEIASFKHRALERGDKQAVRDEDFRYPGPKPQTKEAGIINLADAVESATRTLPSNSPDRLKGMVQTIIRGRFTSGELDECDLTLRDLTKIQEAFLPILQATRHARVLYPWQKAGEARETRRERN